MKSNKAFTLIELLVVVLIIGILAAIAVPQYQVAVGKSKFSTLKEITRSIRDACEIYYLANGEYPAKYEYLDISLPVKKIDDYSYAYILYLENGINCTVWPSSSTIDQVQCSTEINNTEIDYMLTLSRKSAGWETDQCIAFSKNTNDITNRICQQDTGKTANQAECYDSNTYCGYKY